MDVVKEDEEIGVKLMIGQFLMANRRVPFLLKYLHRAMITQWN